MKNCPFCMNSIEDTAVVCPNCENRLDSYQPLLHHLCPGTVLNGKFEVGAVLGEGGFGITYIGKDLNLDIRVALKEYYPMGYVNRSATVSNEVQCITSERESAFFNKGRQSFLREARILAKFSDAPGIVHVRDFFEENNTAYIVMEYLDGEDLKTYLKRKGTLSCDETITLLTPIMKSLQKIHNEGLIHRDISPDNIRIYGNSCKLIDFGAARNITAKAQKSLSVVLKPGFAPEEQYRSKGNQGAWTDVYALCATMYKCITGITPDDATQRVFHDELKKPSELGIDIPTGIEFAIMKGLALTQNGRWQDIGQLLSALNGEIDFARTPIRRPPAKKTEDIAKAPAETSDMPTAYLQAEDAKRQTAPTAEKRYAASPDIEDIPTAYIGKTAKKKQIRNSASEAEDEPTVFIGKKKQTSSSSFNTPDDNSDKPTTYIRKSENQRSSVRTNSNAAANKEDTPTVIIRKKTGSGDRISSSDKDKSRQGQTGQKTHSPTASNVQRTAVQQERSSETKTQKKPSSISFKPQLQPPAKQNAHPAYVSNSSSSSPKRSSAKKQINYKRLTIPIAAVLVAITVGSILLFSRGSGEVVINDVKYSSEIVTVEKESVDNSFMKKISKLKNIDQVTFSDCTIDFGTLSKYLGDTKHLMLENCQVTNWGSLSDMSGLESLRISFCGMTDNDLKKLELDKLEKLRSLDLSGNAVTNFAPVIYLGGLRALALNSCSLSSLEPFAGLSELEELYVGNNDLTSLKGTENMLRLKNLSIDNNDIYDLKPITNCAVLEAFSANDTRLSDISVLSKSAETLRYCSLDNPSYAVSLAPLNGASKLEALSIRNSKEPLGSELRSLSGLKYLCIDGSDVSSFEICDVLGKLTYFSAEGCSFTGQTGREVISSLKSANFLFMADCNVTGEVTLPDFRNTSPAADLRNNGITKIVSSGEKPYSIGNLAVSGSDITELGNNINVSGRIICGSSLADSIVQLNAPYNISEVDFVDVREDEKVKLERQISEKAVSAGISFISSADADSIMKVLKQQKKEEFLKELLPRIAGNNNISVMTQGFFLYVSNDKDYQSEIGQIRTIRPVDISILDLEPYPTSEDYISYNQNSNVTLDKGDTLMYVGNSLPFSLIAPDGEAMASWVIDDTSVIERDMSANNFDLTNRVVIKALKSGTATLTAYVTGMDEPLTCKITVIDQ